MGRRRRPPGATATLAAEPPGNVPKDVTRGSGAPVRSGWRSTPLRPEVITSYAIAFPSYGWPALRRIRLTPVSSLVCEALSMFCPDIRTKT